MAEDMESGGSVSAQSSLEEWRGKPEDRVVSLKELPSADSVMSWMGGETHQNTVLSTTILTIQRNLEHSVNALSMSTRRLSSTGRRAEYPRYCGVRLCRWAQRRRDI
jgi:hypothetical protein